MEDEPVTVPSGRPYFVPDTVDFASLPAAVKLAFELIVQPSYDELVLDATGALERSFGVTLVFMLAEEVTAHFDLGKETNLNGQPKEEAAAAREKTMARLLRVVGAKQQAANFLLRLKALRAKNGPFQGPLE